MSTFEDFQTQYNGFVADGSWRQGRVRKIEWDGVACSFWLKGNKSNVSVKHGDDHIMTLTYVVDMFEEFDLMYIHERIATMLDQMAGDDTVDSDTE